MDVDVSGEKREIGVTTKLPVAQLTRYEEQAYKYIMLLGLLGCDSTDRQTLIGDRSGIQVITDYLVYYKHYKIYLKWACWTLIVSIRVSCFSCYSVIICDNM